jgi:hypothetical protein
MHEEMSLGDKLIEAMNPHVMFTIPGLNSFEERP